MHFGLRKNTFSSIVCCILLILSIFGCKDRTSVGFSFNSPEMGANVNAGEIINVQVQVPKETSVDSIRYQLDGKDLNSVKGAASFSLPTDRLKLGYRMLTAIISHSDNKDTISTNIVLKTNQKPKLLAYRVVNVLPHDTSAYTEGLSYIDGKFLESTGEKGASKLKWVDVKSGKTIQETKLEPQYFGEGSLKIGDKIIMLTWQENIGFIFDAKTLKQLGTFPYQSSREGWGLTFDGKQILRSDGTNRIWYMDPVKFNETGYLEVYDHNGAVSNINELEYINGKIYANVYLTNRIIIIDPTSGRVEAEMDLSALVPKNYFKSKEDEEQNVLNGIAWDEKDKRLFVGGKKWPKLYEIKISTVSAK